MPELTREAMIEAVKAAAEKAGTDLSRADFFRATGISEHQITRLFPEGRWSELKRLAGLERNPKHNAPLDDEEILGEFHRVASELGQIPLGLSSLTRRASPPTWSGAASVDSKQP